METDKPDLSDEAPPVPDAPELDQQILLDLRSRYANFRCPIHDEAPVFNVDMKGSLIESFCCETLMRMFRELSAGDPGDAAGAEEKAT
ncbi:MAG: hypothetical protein U0359_12225 [Byssovorax sp.]